MPQPIILTAGLTRVYQMGTMEVRALDGVELRIEPGEFVAIMGASGSGKSTLMNILGCLDRPSAGSYSLNGQDTSRLNKVQLAAIRNQRIGFVFQSFNLLPRTTALQNVTLPLIYERRVRRTGAEMETRALAALTSVGLADRAHHEPMELSGGQRQRVAIARALVNDPVLIMADEPTGNLDSRTGQEIMALLNDLHRRGRTIVMVTHEPEIATHAERRIQLHDGKIVADRRNGA